jgi:hypothetical protein
MRRAESVLALLVIAAAWHVSEQQAAPVKPAVSLKARSLPLSAVRLTSGPLKHAQDLNASYLLSLEPDRMMAFLRARAGLQPKADG